MVRKLALALCIAAGTAFVAQPAFAEGKADSKTEKTDKKDKKAPFDEQIKKAEDNAIDANNKGKTDLAAAYTSLAEAWKKAQAAKADKKDDDLKAAMDEVDKAKKAVEEARKKAQTDDKKDKSDKKDKDAKDSKKDKKDKKDK